MSNLVGSISRRTFLRLSGAAAATFGLAACGPAAPQSTDAQADAGSSANNAGASKGFASEGVLRVGMEAAYAPYNWQVTKEDAQYTIPIENVSGAFADGYDVQIAKAVAKGMDLSPVAVKLEWDGLIEALNNGQIDVIIAGMTATPERKESIDFTEPYYVGTYGLMVKADSKYASATSIQDFSDAAVLLSLIHI